jgi:hypothetical protein
MPARVQGARPSIPHEDHGSHAFQDPVSTRVPVRGTLTQSIPKRARPWKIAPALIRSDVIDVFPIPPSGSKRRWFPCHGIRPTRKMRKRVGDRSWGRKLNFGKKGFRVQRPAYRATRSWKRDHSPGWRWVENQQWLGDLQRSPKAKETITQQLNSGGPSSLLFSAYKTLNKHAIQILHQGRGTAFVFKHQFLIFWHLLVLLAGIGIVVGNRRVSSGAWFSCNAKGRYKRDRCRKKDGPIRIP